jgi:hypothetical protein
MKFQGNVFLLIVLLLCSCAHSYHYAPEISGDGATWGQDGIHFAVPAHSPQLNMTLGMRSLKQAPKKANLPEGTEVVHVRMSFVPISGVKSGEGAYLEPQEQKLLTFGNMQAPPARVHAISKHRPRIFLDTSKQIVDLFYALPKGVSASDIQWFSIQWKIGFADGKSESQITRFDRHDSAPQNSNDFDDYSNDSVGFLIDDWGWWAP